MQNNPEQNPLAWLKKAYEDELSARAVLKEGAPSTACFLAQQMAEKLLKGLLVLHDKDFPKVHDLLELETLLLDLESEVQEFHHDLELLNRYYIETRYPGDYPEFSQGECQQAYEAALRIKEFVLGKVKSRETSGLGSLGVIILFAAVVALLGGGYWIYNTYVPGTGVACTQETKICSDGSSVSRTGPHCEFAPCPPEALCEGGACPGEVDTSDWKLYRNEQYGFEVRYPPDRQLSEEESPTSSSDFRIKVPVGFRVLLKDEKVSDPHKYSFFIDVLRRNSALDLLKWMESSLDLKYAKNFSVNLYPDFCLVSEALFRGYFSANAEDVAFNDDGEGPGGCTFEIFALKGGYVYSIGSQQRQDDLKVLSTFKFIK